MAKTNITLYSSTPSSNTDINNINIDENCPASGLNNAIRELMAHLKNVDTGSQALTALSVTGDTTISSGNLLVGKTSATSTSVGFEARPNGLNVMTRDGDKTLFLNRLTSDGTIAQFYKDGTSVGSIGAWSSSLLLGTGDVGLAFVDGTPERIQPRKADDQTSADALIDLGHSSNRFKDLYLSGGAYLGGTGSANYLDDYEEGTWTPTLEAYAGTPTFSEAFYNKVGRYVFATCRVNLDGTSDGTAFRINGLPFTCLNTSGSIFGANMIYSNSTSAPVYGLVVANATYAYFYSNDGSTIAYTSAGVNKNFRINFHYFTN